MVNSSYVGRRSRRGGGRRPAMFPVDMWSCISGFKAELATGHPTIWKLNESLRMVQHTRDLVYEQLGAGLQPPMELKKCRDECYQQTDLII
ncbi:hypothetical protein T06_10114 [Trichinella sp. T6]|nr:hypothetical protein T06_10114 [Trichinella sp. T6]